MSLPVLEELMQVIAKKRYLPAKSFQPKPHKIFLIFKVVQAVTRPFLSKLVRTRAFQFAA